MRAKDQIDNIEYAKTAMLLDWYQTAYGQQAQITVSAEVKALLQTIPLNSILYMNSTFYADIAADQKVAQIYKIGEGELQRYPPVDGNTYLPVPTQSVDCMMLMHELDTSSNPHHLLREAERVLTESGYLMIVGLNRFSMYGMIKALLSLFELKEKRCKFYYIHQIRDWLSLLNFEVEKCTTVSYFFPVNHPLFQTKLKFCQRFMRRKGSRFGNIYILMAKKRTIPITPIVFKWKQQGKFSATQLKPSSFTVRKRAKL